MNENEKRQEAMLDQAVEALRQEELSPEQVATISERVRGRLHESRGIQSCEEFQSLIPEFLAGRLTPARRLLLEDHTQHCVRCRKALTAARTDRLDQRQERPAFVVHPWLRWGALAATLLLAALVFQIASWNGLIPGVRMTVAALDRASGPVFMVSDGEMRPVAVGAVFESQELVRTGKGARAMLRLNDGSLVELAERTELGVHEGWNSRTLQLSRGQVIVEAAKQGSGHLYVSTNDCRVAVKGTVFSVNHGVNGSRVSVLEGEVWVEKSGQNTVLTPGEQYSTRNRLQMVPLKTEFSWSENSDQHLALLREMSQLHQELNAASFGDHLRYSSSLIGILPAGTVVYAALPNVSGKLGTVYQLFRQRIEQNPSVSQYFQEHPEAVDKLGEFDDLVAQLQSLGNLVGEEVVIALVSQPDSADVTPILLADVVDADQFAGLVGAQIAKVNPQVEEGGVVQLVMDGAKLDESAKGLSLLVNSGLVMASPSVPLLQGMDALAKGSAPGGFADTKLFETVSHSYANGVDWLLAVDMQRLVNHEATPESGAAAHAEGVIDRLGVTQVQDLVVERKQVDGVSESRAVLTYEGAGKGLISWIAAPGPMGALDFVSPNANLVAAFVVREPLDLVDDLLAIAASDDPDALAGIEEFEATEGVSIRNDIAAPLGGEFVLAVDGPLLPTPAWKIILEVYDPATLQKTVEWAVNRVNQAAVESAEPGINLVGDADGLYQLQIEKTGTSLYYRYVNGYMILTPDPALIAQAQQCASSGYSLLSSQTFASLVPPDSSVNLSGFYYQNLAPLLDSAITGGLAESLAGTGENQAALVEMLKNTPPVLVGLYSEPNRITVAGSGDLERLWMNLGLLSTMGGPEGIQKMLGASVPEVKNQ